MQSRLVEVVAGAGVLLAAIVFLGFAFAGRSGGGGGYTLHAEFEDAAGIRQGTSVTIAGVKIGHVVSVALGDDFYADVTIHIRDGVLIPEESQLAWRQADLIGSPNLSVIIFDSFSPPMGDGDQFSSVDPADNFFELLSSLISQFAASE